MAVGLWAPQAAAQGNLATAGEGDGDDSLQWMVDANVGALNLDSSGFQVAGDLNAGIGQRFWGVTGWGSGSAYEIDTDDVESDTTRLEGAGDAWLMIGDKADALRLVLRASGGGLNYSSTVLDKTGPGGWRDQDSWMGRGSLLVGGLLRPDSSFSAHLALGAGLQFEWYDEVTAVVGTTIDDNQDLSFVGSGRLDVNWAFAPEIVSLRIRSSATYFQLTRTNDFIGTKTGVLTTTTSFRQLEVSTRGFFDIDVAAFYGFRPSVYGGLDLVRVSGEGTAASTTIPVFGAGLNHPWL